MRRPPRFFVTATDTGVGKTQVACALLSLMADAGLKPAPFKPYESGCTDLAAPEDALALRRAARSEDALETICIHRFREPVAPGVAAARQGLRSSFQKSLKAFGRFDGRALVVEGAGGLLVPLDKKHDMLDLIERLGLPVLLVARAGLGTLNHTGLSLLALERRKIPIRAVVLTQTTAAADASLVDNAAWIRRRFQVEVLGPVPFLREPRARAVFFRKTLSSLF